MLPNLGRVAALTLIVAGLTGAIVMAPVWMPRHSAIVAEPTTWVPMPSDGMDARKGVIRELLARNSSMAKTEGGTLALRCGIDNSNGEPSEEYAIAIGDGELAHNAQHWNVDFIPVGDSMDAAIHIVSPYPPPPPPPEPGKAASSSIEVQERLIHYRVDRKDLQPIHDALANAELWLAPQGEEPLGCDDGRPVMIEACVHGQYIARLRNCDVASGEPAQKLWNLLKQRFPQPAIGQ